MQFSLKSQVTSNTDNFPYQKGRPRGLPFFLSVSEVCLKFYPQIGADLKSQMKLFTENFSEFFIQGLSL